ncbi:MAG TPA: FAD-binding protein, partial [Solirubrobacteraceae bacterium]|nr:FAD-binding protein [Solirubrobacteraceae bacterium]
LEGARARGLWLEGEEGRCVGVVCEDGRVDEISARGVILATGGAAALWGRTTNPPGSQGSGLVLGHAAGAQVADMEMLQFHPTAVIGVQGREGFLITEAIRGEGATLHDLGTGERFVEELAPRDEVSRAIQRRLAQTGGQAVGLDMRSIDVGRFPNVVGALREAGLDPARELVPVAPAAHYGMGGMAVDLEGRSSVRGLYGVGEVSCTGLHGANRLASNSLSECFVFARRAVRAALDEPAAGGGTAGRLVPERATKPVSGATRAAMWRYAGIERDGEGLERLLQDEHPVARLVARCGLAREESRGAHVRRDHPERKQELDGRHVVVGGEEAVRWEEWR